MTFGGPPEMDTPLILHSNCAFANTTMKPSAHKRNKYGDKGSPWWIPLDGWIMP